MFYTVSLSIEFLLVLLGLLDLSYWRECCGCGFFV